MRFYEAVGLTYETILAAIREVVGNSAYPCHGRPLTVASNSAVPVDTNDFKAIALPDL